MIPNLILKALSLIRKHGVQHLLMGGQACIFYGAAEFSRDLDLALVADPANLDRLAAAIAELALTAEMEAERAADRAYWQPLRAELEMLRRRPLPPA